MIIPWLKGILDWEKAPMTWMLFALNLFFFYALIEYDRAFDQEIFKNNGDVLFTGTLYQQYLHKNKTFSKEELLLLGSKALRDSDFIQKSEKFSFTGDAIAIEGWKKNIEKYSDQFQKRRSKLFGLSFGNSKILTWITYQFTHANFLHLMGNMLILLVFGSALEIQGGSLLVLFLYLLGGLFGGMGFLWLAQSTISPMVGASGSLSAMMCYYVLFEKKKRIQYFYFLSPIESYYGFLYLPTWVILPLTLLTDIASHISSSVDIGRSVAHSAHIGGGLFGLVLGLLYRFVYLKFLANKFLANRNQMMNERSKLRSSFRDL